MSSSMLRQWVLRTTGARRAAVSLSLRRPNPSSGLHLASGPSLMRRSVKAPLQIRCFHPTPARRLYVSTEALIAGCLGGVGLGILLVRFLLKRVGMTVTRVGPRPKFVPPVSWNQAADEKTRKDVKAIVTAGFEMARNKPIRSRDQAYREAAFQVPHEIARLNPDARRFKVEEMAPLSSLRKTWQALAKQGHHVKSPFNIERDARVFLYFPSDSDKATAAFLAMNAEYHPPNAKPGFTTRTDNQRLLLGVATSIWQCQCLHWRLENSEVLRRIGPIELPLIISFRGVTCGSLWNVYRRDFSDPESLNLGFDLYEKDM